MAKLSELLNQRFRKKEKSKMSALAKKANEGNLTVFSGIFGAGGLADQEREVLAELLHNYARSEEKDISQDLVALISITSEVKAINNQAAILHGERIKKAQEILKRYRDGAFTAWLKAAYGNRQTPYNFLQYYEFYTRMPQALRPQIESMPRQAVYTLASRKGPFSKKEEIVRNYRGASKQDLIFLIRSQFPLEEGDRRKENTAEFALSSLERLIVLFETEQIQITKKQQEALVEKIRRVETLLAKAVENEFQ